MRSFFSLKRPEKQFMRCVALSAILSMFVLTIPAGAHKPDTSPGAAETRPDARPARTIEESVEVDGQAMEYLVSLPAAFDSSKEYPVLVAVPPGSQARPEVDLALELYWQEEAAERGWIVVSPIAWEKTRFHLDSCEPTVWAMLDEVGEQYKVEGGRFHLAGVSNGGIGAFHLAIEQPERFCSLLVLPGVAHMPNDYRRVTRLKDIPVRMYVGEFDVKWHREVHQTADLLKKIGVDCTLTYVTNDEHQIRSIPPSEFFDVLEALRPKASATTKPEANERPKNSDPAGTASNQNP